MAALFETDQQKLPSRIAEAEQALMMRADDLFTISRDSGEQGQAVDDALYALRALCKLPGTDNSQTSGCLERSIPVTGNRTAECSAQPAQRIERLASEPPSSQKAQRRENVVLLAWK